MSCLPPSSLTPHPTPPPSYSEIASCRIDIPRITPQSPPLDDWFRLQTIDRHRLRSQSDHLFPVASGVKFAAEAVAGLLPPLSPPSIHTPAPSRRGPQVGSVLVALSREGGGPELRAAARSDDPCPHRLHAPAARPSIARVESQSLTFSDNNFITLKRAPAPRSFWISVRAS
jgi:hypothetical protein